MTARRGTDIPTAVPLAILLLSVTLVEPAFAQAPAQPEPPPRIEASAQFTFLSTRGNASAQSIGAGGDLIWRSNPWTYSAKAIFAQNESEDVLTARSVAALARAARAIDERWSFYGQYDFLRDVFAGVEQRHVVEGGVSFLAVDARPHRLRFDAGGGDLHEVGPDDELDSATFSAGANYSVEISETSTFVYAPRFLVPLSETSAWKFDQDIALAVAINTIMSVKLTHTLRYVADPPEGFETTDTILTVSFVVKMRRQ